MRTPDSILERLAGTGLEPTGVAPFVILDTPRRWVARVETHHGPVAVKAVAGEGSLDREVTAITTLASLGVPVTALVADLGGDPHVIVTAFAPGPTLHAGLAWGAHRSAGVVLAGLHRSDCTLPDASWPARLWSWVPDALEWWSHQASGHRAVEVLERFVALDGALGAAPSGWCLFDGRPDHMFVTDAGITLIDVNDLGRGDPAIDLAVAATADPALLPGILAGYDASARRCRELATVLPLYVALRRVGAAKWRADTGQDRGAIPGLLELAATVDVTGGLGADGQLRDRARP